MWNSVRAPRALVLLIFLFFSFKSNAQSLLVWEQQRIIYFQTEFGKPSLKQAVNFSVRAPVAGLVIQAPDYFQLSSDGISFSRFAVFSLEQLRKGKQTLYVQFHPDRNTLAVLDTLQLTGAQAAAGQAFFLQGDVFSANQTLDIVNWNIAWFGSKTTGFGPADDDLAQANIKKIMDSLDADVYAFSEVVDTLRFSKLIASMPAYGCRLTDYCSGAANNNTAAYAVGQKLAFVYRKSIFSSIAARGMLRQSESARINWANGRFPFLVEAKIAGSSGIDFILLHGKSGNTLADHQKREGAAKELKDSLDNYFKNKPLIILGDFNDDLDTAITSGIPALPSAYGPFVSDSMGLNHYQAVSFLLSKTGSRTMSAYPDPVDHVILSDELKQAYLDGSVRVVYEVGKWVKNYTTTTSDHYPVISRLKLPVGTITYVINPVAVPAVKIMQSGYLLALSAPVHAGSAAISVYTLQGSLVYSKDEIPSRAGFVRHQIDVTRWIPGSYVLRFASMGKTIALRIFIHP
jgi:endonuclease/exonuclease/phosphatase family metal-dependent hydrolase